jgi:hypothetical protein
VTPELAPSRPLIDPGWLFLAAGLAILACVVIIPAQIDVAEAMAQRDRVHAAELHREQRIARYTEFMGAIEAQEPTVIRALAESQLNQIPADRGALIPGGQVASTDASIFPALEPDPLVLPEPTRTISRLERWCTDHGTRRWLILGGALCVLLGLLPAARTK